jgi:hypothetical protein
MEVARGMIRHEEEGVSVPFGEPVKLELDAFISSITDNTQPPISGEDELKALEAEISCIDKNEAAGPRFMK